MAQFKEFTERLISVMMLFIAAHVVLIPPLLFLLAAGLSLTTQEPTITGLFVGGACCGLAFSIPMAFGLLWTMRESRSGRAGPLLEETAAQLDATVTLPTLWMSGLMPRLKGELHGHPFRLDLSRQAGILGPRAPGEKRWIFKWLATIHMEARLPVKVGFGLAAFGTTGASFLGLRGETTVGELTVWTGDTANGAHIASDEAVLEAARAVFAISSLSETFLRIGPDGCAAALFLSKPLSADDLVRWLRALAALVVACEAAAANAPAGGTH